MKLENIDSDNQEIVWEASKQMNGRKVIGYPKPGLYKYCLSAEQSDSEHETVRGKPVPVGFALRVVGLDYVEGMREAALNAGMTMEDIKEGEAKYQV